MSGGEIRRSFPLAGETALWIGRATARQAGYGGE
jgi:hypothetical protein